MDQMENLFIAVKNGGLEDVKNLFDSMNLQTADIQHQVL